MCKGFQCPINGYLMKLKLIIRVLVNIHQTTREERADREGLTEWFEKLGRIMKNKPTPSLEFVY